LHDERNLWRKLVISLPILARGWGFNSYRFINAIKKPELYSSLWGPVAMNCAAAFDFLKEGVTSTADRLNLHLVICNLTFMDYESMSLVTH
jgi:hypothetical protein